MIKRRMPALMFAVMFVLSLALVGCGGGGDEATSAEKAQEAPAVAATHDCDGGCGMKAVPEAQLTQVDGKWYCAGCVGKAKEGDKHDGHEGHNHG